jgi:O-Antigen ligase
MAGLTLESALLAGILLALVSLLSVGFATRPVIAVPLLVLVEMGTAAFINSAVTLGQMHVSAGDILAVALAVATLLRLQQRGASLRPTRQLVILLAILLLSMARGAAAFGLQPSVNFAREILAMLTAAVFFSTVRVTPRLLRAVRNSLLLAAAVIVFSAVTFWLQHGFGTYATTGSRALNALQALIVLEATIVTVLFPPFRGPVLRRVIPLAGFLIVVLSTERTVWAAGLIAAAVLVVARPKSRGSTSVAATRLLVAAAALAVVLLMAAGPPGVTSDLRAGFQQTSGKSSTFSWRLEGWSILINRQMAGPRADLIAGSPSGTGEDRVINGATVKVGAHSMYVSMLTMTGIIGLALFLWVYVAALRTTRRRLRSASPFVGEAALLFTAVLALQLTFFIGYSSGTLVGLMLGLSCGFTHGSDDLSSLRQRTSINR